MKGGDDARDSGSCQRHCHGMFRYTSMVSIIVLETNSTLL